ncbi:hypothetical protein LSTR_LSTR014520 [Laodelphax striatellus]|uniref:Uncharacterized protein n=1 Tax=Laodelphax striatellus TaxID=195883 RepID=A0A482X9V2_LAOST|nr:hypothetical protein LSTR_LSTR014520 [Laodelphax striatellus]
MLCRNGVCNYYNVVWCGDGRTSWLGASALVPFLVRPQAPHQMLKEFIQEQLRQTKGTQQQLLHQVAELHREQRHLRPASRQQPPKLAAASTDQGEAAEVRVAQQECVANGLQLCSCSNNNNNSSSGSWRCSCGITTSCCCRRTAG